MYYLGLQEDEFYTYLCCTPSMNTQTISISLSYYINGYLFSNFIIKNNRKL